jgi:hypothetical protein
LATSNSSNFTVTRNELVHGALRILGVVGEGQTPTSQQYSDAAEALNYLVKAWENQGVPLWCIKSQDITLVANQTDYNLGLGQSINIAKPLKIYQAYRHTTSNVDIPMTILSQQQYNILGNKATTGAPIQLYYNPQRDYGVLSLFPTPSSADTSDVVRIFYQRPIDDFDASTDNPDVPQEMLRALKYSLAAELAFEYGISASDRESLENKAARLQAEAFAFNTEDSSYFFQADRRTY